MTPLRLVPMDLSCQDTPLGPHDVQRRKNPVSPRLLDLIRLFDVDECAKYPLGHQDGFVRATRISEAHSDDTEDSSIGTDTPETAIEDDSTASAADMRDTGQGAVTRQCSRQGCVGMMHRSHRAHPTCLPPRSATEANCSVTEAQDQEVEIANHDAELHTLTVIPDRTYESDGSMQITSRCDHGMVHLSCQGTSGHLTYVIRRRHSHCRANTAQRDSADAAPPADAGITDGFTYDNAHAFTQPLVHTLFMAFEQRTYGTVALGGLCGQEFTDVTEFSARNTRPHIEVTTTTARTTWTCAAAQHAAMETIRRRWVTPCDGCSITALARLDVPERPRALCADTAVELRCPGMPYSRRARLATEQMLTVITRASTKPTSRSQLCVTASCCDRLRCCQPSDTARARL